jgi:hypothetical protein
MSVLNKQGSDTLVSFCDCAIRQNFEKACNYPRETACRTNAPDAAEIREERLHAVGGCQIENTRIGRWRFSANPADEQRALTRAAGLGENVVGTLVGNLR